MYTSPSAAATTKDSHSMDFWCIKGMALLPSFLVIWSSASFIISYIISVFRGDVEPFVPYISDTGTTPPESGVFGFMISVSAMLGAATMYARYKILAKQNDISSFIKPWLNQAALVIGLIGCIGMGIVATFQEKLIPIVHDVGALITFIGGVIYIVLQSVISYMCRTQWNSMRMCCVRISISVISAIAVLPMIVFGALIGITNSYLDPHEQGYRYRMVSAICEWIIAFSFNMYFLTFIKDFQGVTLKITTEIHDDFR